MSTQNLMAATSLLPQILYSGQIGATDTTCYTVPASSSLKISHGVATNVGAATTTVSISLVPSGGAIDGTHRVVSLYSLAPGDALPLTGLLAGAMLGPGDYISAIAGAAASINIVLTGAVGS